jgi:hypothetical protein
MGLPIPPVITTGVTPSISVVMPNTGVTAVGITYQQFLQSLGSYNYGVNFFYLSATTIQQVGVPVFYRRFDSNGNAISTFLPFAVDPYQSQPSIYYRTNKDEIVFTGLSYIEIPVLPNQRIYLKCFTTIAYLGNELDDSGNEGGDNLFEEIEEAKQISFFEDYCNYLIDNDSGN